MNDINNINNLNNNENYNNIIVNGRLQLEPFIANLQVHELLPGEIEQNNAAYSAISYLIAHPEIDGVSYIEELTLSPNWILAHPEQVGAAFGSFPYEFPRTADITDSIQSNVNTRFQIGSADIQGNIDQFPNASALYTPLTIRFDVDLTTQNVTLRYRSTVLQQHWRQQLI